jgi:RNA polymerase sigma factor (sigma-70 family)
MVAPPVHDEEWFSALYARGYGPILDYGRRRLADVEAASELAQEVFVVAWRRRAEVPEPSLPWLYGVARRLLANQWRARRAAAPRVPVDDLDRIAGSPGADAGVGVADVRSALATLADSDQELLRLVGWEELTVAEAAGVLGCTRAAAAVRLHRARRRLLAAMSNPARRPTPGAATPALAAMIRKET